MYSLTQASGVDFGKCISMTADGAEKAVVDAANGKAQSKYSLINANDDVNWRLVARAFNKEYLHCLDHRLSLVVKHGLNDGMGEACLGSIKAFVLKVLRTNKIRNKYEELRLATVEPPPLLVHFSETRYLSAALMLKRFVLSEPLIVKLRVACLSSPDSTVKDGFEAVDFPDTRFREAKDACSILSPLVPFATALSGEKTASVARLFPAIIELHQALKQPFVFCSNKGDRILSSMVKQMEKYFPDVVAMANNNQSPYGPFTLCAVALSPLTLPMRRSPNKQIRETTISLHLSALHALPFVHEKLFPEEYRLMREEAKNANSGMDNFNLTPLAQEFRTLTEYVVLSESVTADTDPLEWWKERRPLFPRLTKIVRAVLSIVATSTPVERMWNKTKRVFNKLRGNLSPETGGKQAYLRDMHDWLREGGEDVLCKYEAVAQKKKMNRPLL
jgi:hypothetical protein